MKIKSATRYFLYFLAAYLLLHLAVYALQEKFIFLEESLPLEHSFSFVGSTENSPKPDFEEHFLSMKNGDRINALYFKTRDSLKGTVLYFHGNADNLNRWGAYASDFTGRGYDVFMIDYRGYGKSEGKPSEVKLYEDGQKAYDWIAQKIASKNLIIYGRSLGSGIACEIAVHNPAKMLILETPFNEIRDVIQTRYPFLLLKVPFRHRFLNHQKISKINYPIYIFHGTEDKVVPFSCAEKLKKYLKPEDHFYTIEGGGHKNLGTFVEFRKALDELLR